MIEVIFLQAIVSNLPEGKSLNEAISEVLDISYDAAHRRASGKSKFSLTEGVTLAKYFGISMDALFANSKDGFVAVEKTLQIATEKDLTLYYQKSYDTINSLLNKESYTILYSAKDIPIFYTAANRVLSKFKAFVWLKILDPKFKNLDFDNYKPQSQLLDNAEKLGLLYKKFKRKEIWDITTINSLLKQLHFYFMAQQLSAKAALLIADELKGLINKIEEKLNSDEGDFLLYHNELLLMNNSVLIQGEHSSHLYIPFTMLSYYLTNDKITCSQAGEFLQKQLRNSKLLNSSGEKERNHFFIKIYSKIEALKQLIQATLTLDFQ